MRLFVAVVPPVDAADDLAAVVASARAVVPGLRWVAPAQWHLTLAFLGEVEPSRVPELEARLARAAGRYEPMTLQLSGGGQFGARVLYAGVSGDRSGLIRLAWSVQAGARRAGVDVDERPYRPHLTVARSQGSPDLAPAVAVLAGWSGPSWTASEVLLMESRPPEGAGQPPTYVEVSHWTLGRAAP